MKSKTPKRSAVSASEQVPSGCAEKPPLTDEQRSRLHALLRDHQRLSERKARLRAGLPAVLEERIECMDTLRDGGSNPAVERRYVALFALDREIARCLRRTEARRRAVESEIASTPELRAWVLAAAREDE